MRILTLEGFCKEPKGTLFAEITNNNNGEYFNSVLQIKNGYDIYKEEYTFNGVIYIAPECDDKKCNEKSYTLGIDTSKGDYEKNDMFIVYDKVEIKKMIQLLNRCIK